MIAALGHNSRFDEELPPKGERIVSRKRAEAMLTAARLVSTLYRTPKNRILEKRRGGEDGRALRRYLIFYARGIGCPVWECAKIFDLNRKQIGQEEDSYLTMLSVNTELEEDADNMTAMLDAAMRVQTGRFIQVSISEIQAEVACKKAIKTAKEAADLLEASAPQPKPKKVKLTEAERLIADGQAKRRRDKLEIDVAIARSIIAKGKGPGSTKEQRKDAERAERELEAMLANMDQR